MPVDIVISHAAADRESAETLTRHLTPMSRSGKISVWHRDLPGQSGDDVNAECVTRMGRSQIIVLLVSPELEIDRDEDIKEALKQRGARGVRIIPVLVRPVELNDLRYGNLRMLPDGPAILGRRDRDQAWVEVVKGIRQVAELVEKQGGTGIAGASALPGRTPTSTSTAVRANTPASSGVQAPSSQPASASETSQIKILFIGANPSDQTRLELDEEVRDLANRIQMGQLRDRFRLEQAWAMNASDLLQTLVSHKPMIVHFSGHGGPEGELILLDNQGKSAPVKGPALARLFRVLAQDGIRCVVLNACYSAAQAQAIAESIECVVGISGTIPRQSAIAFTAGFYTGIASGRSVQMSFDLGCAQIDVMGYQGAEQAKLLTRSDVQAARLLFR